MESRVSIGWRVGVSIGWRGGVFIGWRGGVSIGWRTAPPLDGGLQVDCRTVSGCLRQVKTPSPQKAFGTLPVFAMWQNGSDLFCHIANTGNIPLCFDQGQVLLLHAPRYMGLNRHVTLAQADMSPWSKQTCHLGASGHVSLEQTDMSPWRKRTCLLGANRHVTLAQADMSPWRKQTCLLRYVHLEGY